LIIFARGVANEINSVTLVQTLLGSVALHLLLSLVEDVVFIRKFDARSGVVNLGE